MEPLVSLQQLKEFDNLEVIASQVVEGFIIGLHKSPFHGFSVEFAEHRLYNQGENTKNIDWKVFARTDKLFVKRYEEETNLRCQIVIDSSSSMYFPEGSHDNKLRFSAYCTAALMHMLRKQRDAVGLSVFSEQVDLHTKAKSTLVHHKLLHAHLDRLLNNPTRNVGTGAVECLHQIAENVHKRSLVIIFSDMLDSMSKAEEMFSALQHLKHSKHEVVLFHVTDKKLELDFEFENRPYLFVDMETGEKVQLQSNQVKEHYVKKIQAFKKDLSLKCAQFGIDFVEADIALPFRQVLLPYLIKRMSMK